MERVSRTRNEMRTRVRIPANGRGARPPRPASRAEALGACGGVPAGLVAEQRGHWRQSTAAPEPRLLSGPTGGLTEIPRPVRRSRPPLQQRRHGVGVLVARRRAHGRRARCPPLRRRAPTTPPVTASPPPPPPTACRPPPPPTASPRRCGRRRRRYPRRRAAGPREWSARRRREPRSGGACRARVRPQQRQVDDDDQGPTAAAWAPTIRLRGSSLEARSSGRSHHRGPELRSRR